MVKKRVGKSLTGCSATAGVTATLLVANDLGELVLALLAEVIDACRCKNVEARPLVAFRVDTREL